MPSTNPSTTRIGIIGSAGRTDDQPKMTTALYVNAFRHLKQLLSTLSPNPELVSGGAAWIDHLAVSYYLLNLNKVAGLRLHLPAPINEHGYYGHPDAKTANRYHHHFQTVTGLQSLSILNDLPALATVHDGFKARNLAIATSVDVLIAFTFNSGNQPKPRSGTAHTWNHSTATTKIHVDLNSLMDGPLKPKA